MRWNYYKLRWTVITNCDSFFIAKCETVYYKLRQVLQSAMNLLQIATGITKCDDYYKLRQYTRSDWLVSHQPFAHWWTPTKASAVKLSQFEKISFLVRSKCTDKIYKWKVEVERVLSCRFVGEWKGQATNLPWRTSSLLGWFSNRTGTSFDEG